MGIRVEANDTHGVRVEVEVTFLPSHSRVGQLFYVYFISIFNTGNQSVQLLRRHWEIEDANGAAHTVDGDGVVGEQPVLQPGQHHRYNSGVPIACAPGRMAGHYVFKNAVGQEFLVPIPAFDLPAPTGAYAHLNENPSTRLLN